MNTASILIKTDPQVKIEAQKTAKELGLSLNVVVTRLLKEFSRRKTITFTSEELTTYAKAQLKKPETIEYKEKVLPSLTRRRMPLPGYTNDPLCECSSTQIFMSYTKRPMSASAMQLTEK